MGKRGLGLERANILERGVVEAVVDILRVSEAGP